MITHLCFCFFQFGKILDIFLRPFCLYIVPRNITNRRNNKIQEILLKSFKYIFHISEEKFHSPSLYWGQQKCQRWISHLGHKIYLQKLHICMDRYP